MFITKNKHYLRSFFFFAKRIIVSMFPPTIRPVSNMKTVTIAIPCAWEGKLLNIEGDVEMLLELLVTEWVSI